MQTGDLFGNDAFGGEIPSSTGSDSVKHKDQAITVAKSAERLPLSERLRPQRLESVIGQDHLLAEGKPLRLMLDRGVLRSLILWGPPGVGKTTLAKLLVKHVDAEFISLSAVFSGVKDIREAVAKAQVLSENGRHTVVFIDEIHRFNKTQQDALLPHVESGLITFVGATTENPSFEVNSALLSRADVLVLNALSIMDLEALGKRAADEFKLGVSQSVLTQLASMADGDGRRMLNNAEQVCLLAKELGSETIAPSMVVQALGERVRRFDNGGDLFYDQISALHKSVRGSDPDAALYWFCRMIDGGVDPKYLSRRLIRMAWEDIGLADPRAMTLVNEAAQTYERLGSPEGELALAEAVIYLAISAKSNAAYKAYNSAMADVKRGGTAPVPMHLRNAPTKLLKDLGHGKSYSYSQDEKDGFSRGQNYWPESLEPRSYYQPTDRGLEQKIAEKLHWLASQKKGGSKL